MTRKKATMTVRHERILEYIGVRGEASVQELADQFGISIVTVRRDLMVLDRQSRITRTHGGAVLSKPGVVEFALAERGEQHAVEKRAIARAVAGAMKPGSTVALDSGTTTLEVAKALVGIRGLTVLTSSLAIASVLYAHESMETVLLGGTARSGSPDLSGWLTEENLKRFHVDYAVVGADGITREGAYTTAADLARVCQGVMAVGTTALLVVDHSKVGRPSFCRYAALNQFAEIITDSKVPPSERRWLNRVANKVTYVTVRNR